MWLIDNWHELPAVCLKTLALAATALAGFRAAPRRALAELRIFDLVVVIATGAIVGRTATAPDASFAVGLVAMVTLLAFHLVVARLRFVGHFARLLDHPVRVLVADGVVDHQQLKAVHLTESDLFEALRERGVHKLGSIQLVLYESKGGLTVVKKEEATRGRDSIMPEEYR